MLCFTNNSFANFVNFSLFSLGKPKPSPGLIMPLLNKPAMRPPQIPIPFKFINSPPVTIPPQRKPSPPENNNKQPSPVNNNKQPSPENNNKQPSPVNNNKPPSPVNNNKQPSPESNNKQPSPVNNNNKPPSPVNNNKQPSPVNNNKQPSPENNNKQPSPVNNNKQPSPVNNNKQPSPVNNNKPPSPENNNKQPSPENNNKQPFPVNNNKQPSPVNNNKPPSPENNNKQPSPVNNNKQPPPVNNNKPPSPENNNKQPSPTLNEKHPSPPLNNNNNKRESPPLESITTKPFKSLPIVPIRPILPNATQKPQPRKQVPLSPPPVKPAKPPARLPPPPPAHSLILPLSIATRKSPSIGDYTVLTPVMSDTSPVDCPTFSPLQNGHSDSSLNEANNLITDEGYTILNLDELQDNSDAKPTITPLTSTKLNPLEFRRVGSSPLFVENPNIIPPKKPPRLFNAIVTTPAVNNDPDYTILSSLENNTPSAKDISDCSVKTMTLPIKGTCKIPPKPQAYRNRSLSQTTGIGKNLNSNNLINSVEVKPETKKNGMLLSRLHPSCKLRFFCS